MQARLESQRQAFMKYWRAHPDCTVTEAAAVAGINSTYGSSILQSLEDTLSVSETVGAHTETRNRRARHERKKKILAYWHAHPSCTLTECGAATGNGTRTVHYTIQMAIERGELPETEGAGFHRARREGRPLTIAPKTIAGMVEKIADMYEAGKRVTLPRLCALFLADKDFLATAYDRFYRFRMPACRAYLFARAKALFIDDPDALAVNVAAVLKYNPNVDYFEIAELMGVSYEVAKLAFLKNVEIAHSSTPHASRYDAMLEDWKRDHRPPPPGYDEYIAEIRARGAPVLGVRLYGAQWARYYRLYQLRRKSLTPVECEHKLGILGDQNESTTR